MDTPGLQFSVVRYGWLRWLFLVVAVGQAILAGPPSLKVWAIVAAACFYCLAANDALRRVPGTFPFTFLWLCDFTLLCWTCSGLPHSPLPLLLFASVALACLHGSAAGAIAAVLAGMGGWAFLNHLHPHTLPTVREYGMAPSLLLFAIFGVLGSLLRPLAQPEPVPATTEKETPPGKIDKDQALAEAHRQSRELVRGKEQTERELGDKQRKLNTIMQVSRMLGSVREPDELLRIVARHAREELNAGNAFVMLVGKVTEQNGVRIVSPSIPSLFEEDEATILYVAIAENLSDLTSRLMNCRPGQGIFGGIITGGHTVRLSEGDSSQMEQFGSSIERFRNVLCVPLQSQWDRHPFGVLGVGNALVGDRFTEEQEAYLKMIASEAAQAIKNIVFFHELERSYSEIIMALAQAIEAKDPYTSGHVDRVRHYSVSLAQALNMSAEEVRIVEQAAVLHDVGKIATPDSVLLKPGILDADERVIMDRHVDETRRILKGIRTLPKKVVDMAALHHERYDGKGYPSRLKGDQIPMGAQIIAVADAFDAMTTDRPYRKGFTVQEALKRLAKGSGTQFNPAVIEAFIDMFSRQNLGAQSELQTVPSGASGPAEKRLVLQVDKLEKRTGNVKKP